MDEMKSLEKPNFDVKEILQTCASSYRDKIKYNNFIDNAEYIKKKSCEYDQLASAGQWDKILQEEKVNGIIDKKDMISLYEDKFVKHLPEREQYYDKIMSLAVHGKCPICGIGQVSNLDHYLAKSIYPTYSVTPTNLIPVCRDCNYAKSSKSFSTNNEAPFHPYYDEIDSFIWLKASIKIVNNSIVATYYISDELETTHSELYYRLKNHFEILELDKAYSIQAATEIAENITLWITKYFEWGKESFKEYLDSCLASKIKFQQNTWKTALFRALIENIHILEEIKRP